MPKILIVDDNPDILDALDLLLSLQNYQVTTACNQQDAIIAVYNQNIDLVIQDMNFSQGETSGDEGKSLFTQIRQHNPTLPIIIITAWTQLETAIELVKAGASDYLHKPWDDNKLLALINKYVVSKTVKPITDSANVIKEQLIYKSPQMHELVSTSEKVANANINVLITGANGSGKEKLADYIHQRSTRHSKPFIKVNMGALPHELMEAELFGAEKGAFTGANQARKGRFEAADNGTLFLDEIGNLSLSGQMKLLRVLQTGEFERVGSSQTIKVDVRVISATNANLPAAIKQGVFREDLYYRLNVVELNIPALKDRKADILPLAQYFIGNEYVLSDDAKQYLLAQSWSGNVRELENACKRAIVFASPPEINKQDLLGHQTVDVIESEKQQIEDVLLKHNGVIKYAAEELGLSRQALYRRIEKFQIEIVK